MAKNTKFFYPIVSKIFVFQAHDENHDSGSVSGQYGVNTLANDPPNIAFDGMLENGSDECGIGMTAMDSTINERTVEGNCNVYVCDNVKFFSCDTLVNNIALHMSTPPM